MKFGCHLSAAKGLYSAAKTAISIGADTFQYFTRNPRGGNAKAINEKDIALFLNTVREYDMKPVLAHAPYTLNCCSKDESIRDFAFRTMKDDLQRMEYTPYNLYNFHPGSHTGQGVGVGVRQIAEILNRVLDEAKTTTVLLETMSGKGSEVGSRFEELATIIALVEQKEKLGVCFDTCHVHDAGYDIVHNLDGVLKEFDRIVGLERLKAIHLNDSLNPCNAHKDRHALLGEGYIGMTAIKNIIHHSALKHLPCYLETPTDDTGHGKEIAMLKEL